MQIQLGNTTSPQRKIYKNFTVGVTKTVQLLDTEDVCNPQIVLTYNPDDTVTVDRYNYAYIPQLHRYYWVEHISEVIGSMCTLTLRVDVLMTYKPDIANTDLMVVRSSTDGSGMIPDVNLPLYPYKETRYIKFDKSPFFNGFTDQTRCFILNVAGKKNSI